MWKFLSEISCEFKVLRHQLSQPILQTQRIETIVRTRSTVRYLGDECFVIFGELTVMGRPSNASASLSDMGGRSLYSCDLAPK